MLLQHSQLSIELLGDPHLGRSFTNGVPLARRGERENMVWADFEKSVMQTTADIHICMGDIFDRWSVPYDVVHRAIDLYRRADANTAQTTFYILRGNHDISLDLERKGAFDVFTQAFDEADGVIVVNEPTIVGGLGLFPWHPTKKAEELLRPCEIAFGHWDTIFGFDNLIPTARMAELGIKRAYTGHVHQPDAFTRDGVRVNVVGSMQPYAHGEDDPDDPDPMYVTLSLAEIEGRNLRNKCVRVKLAPGEVLDHEIDCLQLTVQRHADSADDDIAVELEKFDIEALMARAFVQEDVPEEVRSKVIDRFHEKRAAA